MSRSAATLLFFGLGGVAGPTALGAVGGRFGLGTAFVVAAALILLNLLVGVAEHGRGEDPS